MVVVTRGALCRKRATPLPHQVGMLLWPQLAGQLVALTSSPALRHAATKGILVAMACTFFEAFNVPVFWPILVMYFIMLFCITMKRQIKVSVVGTAALRGAESPLGSCLYLERHVALCNRDTAHCLSAKVANTDLSHGAVVQHTDCSLGAGWEGPSVLPCCPHWNVVLGAQSLGPTGQSACAMPT